MILIKRFKTEGGRQIEARFVDDGSKPSVDDARYLDNGAFVEDGVLLHVLAENAENIQDSWCEQLDNFGVGSLDHE